MKKYFALTHTHSHIHLIQQKQQKHISSANKFVLNTNELRKKVLYNEEKVYRATYQRAYTLIQDRGLEYMCVKDI